MRELKQLVGHRVIASTDDTVIDGRVLTCSRTAVVLGECREVSEPTNVVPIDGHVIIPLARLAHVQVP